MVNQSTTDIFVSWVAPTLTEANDCAVEGYRILLEDILEPGFTTIYNGLQDSSQTMLHI